MKKKIFVYGTLLEGYGNHRYFLEGQSNKLGEFTTEKKFTMIHLGGFPGVIEEGDTAIKGEVYEVEERVARNIDGLEGYRANDPTAGLYNKKFIDTPFGEAGIYIYNNKSPYDHKIIPSGNWKENNTENIM